MKYPTKTEILLLFFIAVGIVLRLWNIGFQHTNWDEQFTLQFARPDLGAAGLIIQALSTDFTPPLYYLFAQFSMSIFGQTAEAIRYPSAVAGVLLIPAMYLIGKQYRDELLGILMAGFITIFYNAVFYSKYGRAYSFELLFFAMAFYFFMQVVAGQRDKRFWFALFCILTLWTHLFAIFPIGVMVLYLLWNEKFDLKHMDWLVAIVAGCLPLLTYVRLVLFERQLTQWTNFGAPIHEILFLIPLDIFTYSVFITFPIVVWVLWKGRNDPVFSVIIMASVATYISMIGLSFKTQIILHYALPLIIMLLLPFTMPFYLALKESKVSFHHLVTAMIIIILELVQVSALISIQRGFW